ncbi:MAG: hypothetical protein ACRD9S_14105 [Pyrinomonadaceae bacterium]
MRTRIFSLALVAAMLFTQSAVVLAQGSTGGWPAVQAIATDERLIVKLKDGKSIEGDMIEASDTNLSLARGKKVVNIPRSDIQSIWHAKGKAAKTKWALIGAGVGAGVGGGIGASKVSRDRDDSEIWLPVGLLFGAGIGALGGVAVGASRRSRELIYYAP